ncbi:hypothetical protein GE09DRAFT_1257267 [Coniochaeta sp. 2T2.1]|nr:hypothetical protein GE09DRAFT_1257267 [Coniochaeta sp. 2T2.1]
MLAKSFILFAALASAVIAAPQRPVPGKTSCRSTTTAKASTSSVKPTSTPVTIKSTSSVSPTSTKAAVVETRTLPNTGAGTQLPAPAAGSVLKMIALGHGLQNYSCATASGNASATGALAVLYDITQYYPGTPRTGLPANIFNDLSKLLLFGQDLPLNLVNPAAAKPGTPTKPNTLPEKQYVAVTSAPFKAPADIKFGPITAAKEIGRHYFASPNSVPTFDLSAKTGLVARVQKVDAVTAPASAEKGITKSGAVAWLRLPDNGASVGVTEVYRVVTAGGVASTCDIIGQGEGSVPYTAQYWFFGKA